MSAAVGAPVENSGLQDRSHEAVAGGNDIEQACIEHIEVLYAVAMRYANNDRRTAHCLAAEALHSAIQAEQPGTRPNWPKSHLLKHLRAAYLARQSTCSD